VRRFHSQPPITYDLLILSAMEAVRFTPPTSLVLYHIFEW